MNVYPDVPTWLSIMMVVAGLAALAWSADRFIYGAAAVSRRLGISPFIVGMVIIGFGTSAPELCVSTFSGITDHSNLSLGNAYGSCIFNVAVILGVAALIRPIKVKPSVTFGGAPMLVLISVLSCALVKIGDGFSRLDGVAELALFAVLLPVYCWYEQREKKKGKSSDDASGGGSLFGAVFWLVFGLGVLVGSSYVLVWGSVDLARSMGVSELMIGLTVVAAGTSLPELASAVASARRGKHEFVLGNIVGSNLFNTLAVVGLAGTLSPFRDVSKYLVVRDLTLVVLLSVSITVFGINWSRPKRPGRINRAEGVLWLLVFAAYTCVMICQEAGR